MAETKRCIDCSQEFSVNELGHLVVPFFDVHSAICERCGKPLNIEYTADGRVNYGCSRHLSGSGPALYGYSDKYCPSCDKRRRIERSVPCCVCQQKKGNSLVRYQGYTLWGGGTAIHLFVEIVRGHFWRYLQVSKHFTFVRAAILRFHLDR
jgi:hypothetical protein